MRWGFVILAKVFELLIIQKAGLELECDFYQPEMEKRWCFLASGIWQYIDPMSSEIAKWPRQMVSLICFRVIIPHFVQVINCVRGFRFIMRWLLLFFFGIINWKWRALCSLDLALLCFLLISGVPAASWDFFTLHLCDSFTSGGF